MKPYILTFDSKSIDLTKINVTGFKFTNLSQMNFGLKSLKSIKNYLPEFAELSDADDSVKRLSGRRLCGEHVYLYHLVQNLDDLRNAIPGISPARSNVMNAMGAGNMNGREREPLRPGHGNNFANTAI